MTEFHRRRNRKADSLSRATRVTRPEVTSSAIMTSGRPVS